MLQRSFLRRHWRLLAFGWLMAFFSSFGQTYFISVFGGEIREAFGLSHGGFGTCYAIGTLSSAFLLLWAGRLIDTRSLLAFSLVTIAGLALSTAAMAAVVGAISLTLVVFGLRFFGQGLMTHAAMTAMGRYFDAERGRAVSFASLGHIAGWALMPLVVSLLLNYMDWRSIWLVGSVVLLFGAALAVILLLRTHPENSTEMSRGSSIQASVASRTLSEALADRNLYLQLPALLAPAFITTGLVFHQVHIGTVKGWSLSLIASSLSAFALGSVAATLATGVIVDRWSARRVLPVGLLPIAIACVVLASSTSAIGALAFFALLGVGSGLMQVLLGAIWAELYGTAHLGAIRAFGTSAMVFSSGLAPPVMGALIDLSWTIDALAIVSAAYCVLVSLLAAAARP